MRAVEPKLLRLTARKEGSALAVQVMRSQEKPVREVLRQVNMPLHLGEEETQQQSRHNSTQKRMDIAGKTQSDFTFTKRSLATQRRVNEDHQEVHNVRQRRSPAATFTVLSFNKKKPFSKALKSGQQVNKKERPISAAGGKTAAVSNTAKRR